MTTQPTRFRWTIVGLIFFITVLNYMDRSSISYAVDVLSQKFHLTDNHIGFILGAFSIGYVITTFFGGICVDRYGARRTLFFSAVLWSFALFLGGFSVGFLTLVLSRIFLGLAEGPNFPALSRSVSDWLSLRERTRALSYALMAVPLGLAIGAPVISQLIIWLSWRGMFIALALLTLCWLPFWWFLFRDSPLESKHINNAELTYIQSHQDATTESSSVDTLLKRQKLKGLWKFLLSDTTLLVNYWAFFVFGYYLFFFMGWLPTYLSNIYSLNLHQIGLFSILPWILGALMMWGCGALSDYIFKKTQNFRASRTHVIWISQLCAAFCIFPIVIVHNLTVAIIFISLAVGFILSANGAYYAVNIDIAKQRAGTAIGVMDSCFALSGFVSPVLTGWLTVKTGNFHAAFILMSCLAISSVILLLQFHKPEKNPRFS